MTDDRSQERAARSWLEQGPTEAPDRAVEAALLKIQTTRQERALPLLWRLPSMNATSRLLAALATVAIVVVGGMLVLRPGTASTAGSNPTPNPTANPTVEPSPSATVTPPVAACGLVTTAEAANYGPYGPGTGATSAGSGNGPTTTCRYTSGDIALTVTLTKPGGKAAFDMVKASPGITLISDVGMDGVFDPATATLYVSKGDALVAIVTGSAAKPTADRLAQEKTVVKLIVDRM